MEQQKVYYGMKKVYLLITLVTLVMLTSAMTCTSCQNRMENNAMNDNLSTDIESNDTPMRTFNEKELLDRANLTLQYIKDRDFQSLSTIVHKDKGVRFLPYAYGRFGQIFTASQLAELKLTDMYEWWNSGYDWDVLVELSVGDYFDIFVYNRDYLNAPLIGIDEEFVFKGFLISNIDEVFPETHRVVYQFPATEEIKIDWDALNLIFAQENGQWMLVGVVHACWTL
ncbi:MAG: hypothetical protein FWG14_06165 [Peptococcaceae bacterium]|nr:hypothetical protein [Peptococcaceae bacterium]